MIGHIGRGDRWQSREVDRGVSELAEAELGGGLDGGEVKKDGKAGGAGGEDVSREAELGGNEGGDAEEVEDDGEEVE